jgi:hypothetical protein
VTRSADKLKPWERTSRSFQISASEWALVDEFLAEQALFQQSLAERALGRERHTHVTTDTQVWYNYLLLQVWDRLSLQYAFSSKSPARPLV